MAGELTIFEQTALYWVHSRLGPIHDGVHHGHRFVEGHLPAPVCGTDASAWRSRGYNVTEWEDGVWWDGWEQVDGEWSPVFCGVVKVAPGTQGTSRRRGRKRG